MKDLAYYRQLPYVRRVELHDDESGRYWVAEIADLPGCMIHGETVAEAHANLNEVFDDYIEAMLAAGLEIPEPQRSLHYETASIGRPEATRWSVLAVFEPVTIQPKPSDTTAANDHDGADEIETDLETIPA